MFLLVFVIDIGVMVKVDGIIMVLFDVLVNVLYLEVDGMFVIWFWMVFGKFVFMFVLILDFLMVVEGCVNIFVRL